MGGRGRGLGSVCGTYAFYCPPPPCPWLDHTGNSLVWLGLGHISCFLWGYGPTSQGLVYTQKGAAPLPLVGAFVLCKRLIPG